MAYILPRHIQYVLERLRSQGFQAAVAGGAVRDLLIDRIPRDFDVVSTAQVNQIRALFDRSRVVGEKYGTVLVTVGDHQIEVSTCRGLGGGEREWAVRLREDLRQRDFTINAMAIDASGDLVDPCGGRQDIALQLIRAPENQAEGRFQDDPLRMLRAVRLATVLDYQLDRTIFPAMKKCLPLLGQVAVERIREELAAVLLSEHPARGLRIMLATGLLKQCFPELMAMVGFEQHNPAHINDVFNHSLAVVESVPPQLEIRLAALLHDIGKPATFTLDSRGVGHFYHHQEESQRQTVELLNRLRFSRAVVDKVSILVGNHMYWLTSPDREAVSRLLLEVGEENLQDLFVLQKADIQGSAYFHDSSFIDHAEVIYQHIKENKLPVSVKDLQVDGNDLLAMGYPPDARLGQALQHLLDTVIKEPGENRRERLLEAAQTLLSDF